MNTAEILQRELSKKNPNFHHPPLPTLQRGQISTNEKIEILGRNSYLDKTTTSLHFETNKKEKKRSLKRSERMKIKRSSKRKIVECLRVLGEADYADSMAMCAEQYRVLQCESGHISAKRPFHICGIRFCPFCAARKSSEKLRQYTPYALEFARRNPHFKACLLTLTQAKIKGERLRDSRNRLMQSFIKLQRRDFFNEYFAGGIYSIENVFSEEGNHCHLHIVIFRRKFIDEKLLKHHWSKVSPGAKNLNIRLIDKLELGLLECLKYISKPIPTDRIETKYISELLSLKGANMCGKFGQFKRDLVNWEVPEAEANSEVKQTESGECCTRCNKVLFEKTVTLSELIELTEIRESETLSAASTLFAQRLLGHMKERL